MTPKKSIQQFINHLKQIDQEEPGLFDHFFYENRTSKLDPQVIDDVVNFLNSFNNKD